MFKEIIAPVALWILAILVLVTALTGLHVWNFSNDCAASGGTFTNEGMTSWCRY